MKKIMSALLALALMMTFALAEEIALGDFSLLLPEHVKTETVENVLTCIRDQTRVVVQLLPQQMKEDALHHLQEMMLAYDPAMTLVKSEQHPEGVALAWGLIENSFGEGLHQYVTMVLSGKGLLILSAYHLSGDHQAASDFLAELLALVKLDGAALLP